MKNTSHLHPLQVQAWRRMSPDEKWSLTRAANALMREAVRQRLLRRYPDISSTELERETSLFLLHART